MITRIIATISSTDNPFSCLSLKCVLHDFVHRTGPELQDIECHLKESKRLSNDSLFLTIERIF
jgi:hypothetical protein